MGVVSTWLAGIGLDRTTQQKFRSAGITTPELLAALPLDGYDELGVTDPSDRKKLFYLVQRIRMAVGEEERMLTQQRRQREEHEDEEGEGQEIEEGSPPGNDSKNGGSATGEDGTEPHVDAGEDEQQSSSESSFEHSYNGGGDGGGGGVADGIDRAGNGAEVVAAASSRLRRRKNSPTPSDRRTGGRRAVERKPAEEKPAESQLPVFSPKSPFAGLLGDEGNDDDGNNEEQGGYSSNYSSSPPPSPPREPGSGSDGYEEGDDDDDDDGGGIDHRRRGADRGNAADRKAMDGDSGRGRGRRRQSPGDADPGEVGDEFETLETYEELEVRDFGSAVAITNGAANKRRTGARGRRGDGKGKRDEGEPTKGGSRRGAKIPSSDRGEASPSPSSTKRGARADSSSRKVAGKASSGRKDNGVHDMTTRSHGRRKTKRDQSSGKPWGDLRVDDEQDDYSLSNFESDDKDDDEGGAHNARQDHTSPPEDDDDGADDSDPNPSPSPPRRGRATLATEKSTVGSGHEGRRRSQRLQSRQERRNHQHREGVTSSPSPRPATAASSMSSSVSSTTRMKLLRRDNSAKSSSSLRNANDTSDSDNEGTSSGWNDRLRPRSRGSSSNLENDVDGNRASSKRTMGRPSSSKGRVSHGGHERKNESTSTMIQQTNSTSRPKWSRSSSSPIVRDGHGTGSGTHRSSILPSASDDYCDKKGERHGLKGRISSSGHMSDSTSTRSSSLRHRSQIQPPSTSSKRTSLGGSARNRIAADGRKKRLSTIPAGTIAPMSPLNDISSNHDSNPQQEGKTDQQQHRASARGRRRSVADGQGRSSSSSSARHRRLSAPVAPSRSLDDPSARRAGTKTKRRSIGGGKDRRRSGSVTSGDFRTAKKTQRSQLPSYASSLSPAASNAVSPHRPKTDKQNIASLNLDDMSASSADEPNMNSSARGAVFIHGEAEDDSWATMVSQLREEKAAHYSTTLAAGGFEEDDEDMRIRVVVRKRPMSRREESSGEVDVIHPIDEFGRVLVYQPKTRVDLTKEVESSAFAFDDVFGEGSTNAQIYERSVRHLIPGVFERKWVSLFSYGQTGSGKTFTMMGSSLTGMKGGSHGSHDKRANLGLYFLAAQDVFQYAKTKEFAHLSVSVSLFEIYGGKLFDLLNTRNQVKCLEDHKGKVCFPGLSEHGVQSAEELMQVIEAGAVNRSMGTTSANADSSRSHAVLQLSLRKTVGRRSNVEHGRLSFIDLAGSERGADTNTAGRTTRLEGAEINTSLLALKEVIRALAVGDTMQHIPFRGSKLTQVLKESFVGKMSRTVMIACVAPNLGNCEHTMNTLRYADRVKERDPENGVSAVAANSSASKNQTHARDTARTSGVNYSAPECQQSCSVSDKSIDCYEQEQEEAASSTSEAHLDTGKLSDEEDLMGIDEFLQSTSSEESDSPMLLSPSVAEVADAVEAPPASQLRVGDGEYETNDKEDMTVQIKKAAQPLIANHRATMTGLLGMVKNEMLLVNCTDADRDTIEEYVTELEKLQDTKLDMISSLRDSLSSFYATRDALHQKHNYVPVAQRHSIVSEDILSDDTFEDLRD